MPIHVLKVEKKGEAWSFDKVFEWTEEYLKGKDYALLVTDEYEIVLEPRKSTRPLDFGYIAVKDPKALNELVEELEKRYALRRIEIKSLGWDVENPPWVKIPPE